MSSSRPLGASIRTSLRQAWTPLRGRLLSACCAPGLGKEKALEQTDLGPGGPGIRFGVGHGGWPGAGEGKGWRAPGVLLPEQTAAFQAHLWPNARGPGPTLRQLGLGERSAVRRAPSPLPALWFQGEHLCPCGTGHADLPLLVWTPETTWVPTAPAAVSRPRRVAAPGQLQESSSSPPSCTGCALPCISLGDLKP